MAIDLEAVKRKLNQLQTVGTRQNNLWKPEPGKQTIRIVPYQHDRANPFRELYFHYDLGKKNYLSPVTYGEADPVVEFADKLKSTGTSQYALPPLSTRELWLKFVDQLTSFP